MTIKDFVENNLVQLKKGTPILLTTLAEDMEVLDVINGKGKEIRTYLFKWGGLQEGNFGGYSQDGECAYPYFIGEIFRLGHLAEAWGNKPALMPVRKTDDKGLSYMLLQKYPKSVIVGKEAILSVVEGMNLVEYKVLLEEMLQ